MPYVELKIGPGVNTQATPVKLHSAAWSQSNLIRWKDQQLQKLGGWAALNLTPIVGIGRGLHVWADLMGNAYLAVGTDQRLQLFFGGLIYDITPIRLTTNAAPAFSTVMGTPTVTIHDTGNGSTVGDWVEVNVPVSVGGLIIQGFYQVQTVIDADHYTITAAGNATSTVVNGGAVPLFTNVAASANVTVTLANHGLSTGSVFTVQVATTVAGITMGAYTSYLVTSVVDANNFVIQPGAIGTGGSASENGGDAQLLYLVPSGLVSAIAAVGYGIGDYGAGDYGISGGGGSAITLPLRLWFLDNWGQDLIGNYTGSPIFVWVPPEAPGNVALAINTTNFPGAADPPATVNGCFVSMPQQILVAWGCDPVGGGTQDPNLVRWCDVADFTDWLATAANQAGSYRIPTGSRIVGGLQGPSFGVLWTDIDVYLMQYVQPPLVFGFTKISGGNGLLAPHGCGILGNKVFWVSANDFFVFDGGSAQAIPCTVWDKFFNNLNTEQKDKICCACNSVFGEVYWYYPSASGNGEVDSYVKVSVNEGWVWDYGTLDRTAWSDTSALGMPIGSDASGLLQQHEVSNDANGQPMSFFAQSGFLSISDGTMLTFIDRIIGDFLITGGTAPNNRVFVSIIVQDYQSDATITYGPFPWSSEGPPYSIVRARGRVVAVRIEGYDPGIFARVGGVRYLGAPAGRR